VPSKFQPRRELGWKREAERLLKKASCRAYRDSYQKPPNRSGQVRLSGLPWQSTRRDECCRCAGEIGMGAGKGQIDDVPSRTPCGHSRSKDQHVAALERHVR